MVESSASDTALMHMPVSSTFFGVNRSVSFPMSGPSTPISSSTIEPPADGLRRVPAVRFSQKRIEDGERKQGEGKRHHQDGERCG